MANKKSALFTAPLMSFASPASTGQWTAYRKYETPVKAMLYDGETGKTIIWEAKNGGFEKKEVAGVITLKGMFWPHSQYFFKLRWTELVANKETAENAVYTDGPKKGQKLYKSIRTFQHSDIVIAVREEDGMPYIRQKEVHPIAIEFNCNGGGSYVIVALITTCIDNPLVSIQLEHLLDAGIGRVTEAILNWGKAKKFEEAQLINVDDHNQIKLKDRNGNEKFYLDVINEQLVPLGLNIPDVTILDHFIGDNSTKVFENMNQTLIEKAKVEQATYKKQARIEENLATEKENDTELKYDTGLLQALTTSQTAILEKEAEVAHSYVKGGSKLQYLNIGGEKGSINMGDLLLSLKKERKTKGGANAA